MYIDFTLTLFFFFKGYYSKFLRNTETMSWQEDLIHHFSFYVLNSKEDVTVLE